MIEQINDLYNKCLSSSTNDFIGFINCGYWKGIDDGLELAQLNLIETLASFFVRRRDGNILDVACGRGASSKFLTKYFNSKSITGIDAAENHVHLCKLVAPNSDFKIMDATKLQFEDSSFDNILCIDAAYHFLTRQKFLEEAYRVLRPGGRLAISDIVVREEQHHRFWVSDEFDWPRDVLPVENCMPDLDTYRESLLKIGFNYVRLEDVTEFTLIAGRRFLIKRAELQQDYSTLEGLVRRENFASYCMVYAIKY